MFEGINDMAKGFGTMVGAVVGILGYGLLVLVTPLSFSWFGPIGSLFNLLKEVI